MVGNFFGGSVMQIIRKNLFDFMLTLTEDEFRQVKNIADCENISIFQALADVIETGLYIELQQALKKE